MSIKYARTRGVRTEMRNFLKPFEPELDDASGGKCTMLSIFYAAEVARFICVVCVAILINHYTYSRTSL